MLAESVRLDFIAKYQLEQYHLYVYVFYNKQGLVNAIGRAGYFDAKLKFDEFSFGFNQAAERFIMVDVGGGKEQADAKIKGALFLFFSHLPTESIYLKCTWKIISVCPRHQRSFLPVSLKLSYLQTQSKSASHRVPR